MEEHVHSTLHLGGGGGGKRMLPQENFDFGPWTPKKESLVHSGVCLHLCVVNVCGSDLHYLASQMQELVTNEMLIHFG